MNLDDVTNVRKAIKKTLKKDDLDPIAREVLYSYLDSLSRINRKIVAMNQGIVKVTMDKVEGDI